MIQVKKIIDSLFTKKTIADIPTHLFFLLLSGLRVFVLLGHEIWRDEAQIPLLVRDSNSFGDMLYWQAYERGHALWPTILYGVKSVGLDPVLWAPWLHLGFSIITLVIIFYGIPRLPLYIRVLAGASYILLYEYTAITRVYGAAILLFAIFIMLEIRTNRYMLWKSLTLALLALSSSNGLILAVASAVYLFARHWKERLAWKTIGIGIVAVGIILSVLSAISPSELAESSFLMEYRASVFDTMGIPRILETCTRVLLGGFLYMPLVSETHWWDLGVQMQSQSLLSSLLVPNNIIAYIIGLLVIIFAFWALWRLFKISKPVALAMAILWGGNLIAWATMHPGLVRHYGVMVIGTLGFLVLARDANNGTSPKWIRIFVSIVLCVQLLSGAWAVYGEQRDEFSQSKNLAEWYQTNYPQETPYVYPDYVGAELCFYKGGYAYSLASGKQFSFVQQQADRYAPFSVELLRKLDLTDGGKILITTFPYHAVLDEGRIIVEPIKSFQPSVANDAAFWVHVVRAGNPEEIGCNIWTTKHLAFEEQGWQIKTIKTESKNYSYYDEDFNNATGSTLELRMKLLDAPTTGWQGTMVSLDDGKREGKLCFFKHYIELRDQNTQKARYIMDTMDVYHTYRITILGDIMSVYIDDNDIGSITLSNKSLEKQILFGDFSTVNGENINADIEYLAYSTKGAIPSVMKDHIQTGLWTQYTYMETLSGLNTGRLWVEQGIFSVKSVTAGALNIATTGVNTGFFTQNVPEFDNTKGSTAEVRLKLVDPSPEDVISATLLIQDGTRQGEVSFFIDHIKVLDKRETKSVYWLDTTDTFHTYRITMIKDILRVYVDGQETCAVLLSNSTEMKNISFGDFSTEKMQNTSCNINYIAYTTLGAISANELLPKPIMETEIQGWSKIIWGISVKTVETGVSKLYFPDDNFDSKTGSTAEIRMKLLEAPISGWQAAMFSIADGKREGKICFFNDRIEIADQNNIKATYKMDTTDAFHTYRLTLWNNTLTLYVDAVKAASISLSNAVDNKKIIFGDFNENLGENVHALIEYIAYSTERAMFIQEVTEPPVVEEPDETVVEEPDETVVEEPDETVVEEPDKTWIIINQDFTINTTGNQTQKFVYDESLFDNDTGSTVEIKMKLREIPSSGWQAMMLSLSDGKREGKICFYRYYIEIADQNSVRARHLMSTIGEFHTYRITILHDDLTLYVDSQKVATIELSANVQNKKVLFGDFSTQYLSNISAEVDYLAYSYRGALLPEEEVTLN